MGICQCHRRQFSLQRLFDPFSISTRVRWRIPSWLNTAWCVYVWPVTCFLKGKTKVNGPCWSTLATSKLCLPQADRHVLLCVCHLPSCSWLDHVLFMVYSCFICVANFCHICSSFFVALPWWINVPSPYFQHPSPWDETGDPDRHFWNPWHNGEWKDMFHLPASSPF